MTSYSVDVDELAAVTAAMSACSRALSDQAVALDRAHERLHSEWSGLASDAHDTSHVGWRASFEEMSTALAGMRLLGEAARASYSAAVEANVELWRQAT